MRKLVLLFEQDTQDQIGVHVEWGPKLKRERGRPVRTTRMQTRANSLKLIVNMCNFQDKPANIT